MSSPTILYCGTDECLRIPVLEVAGFRVARCGSLEELQRRLEEAPEIGVVLFEEADGSSADSAAGVVKESSAAARILFRHPAGSSSEANFDLVIGSGTPPARWLQQVAETLLARAGFGDARAGWAQIARDLQARRRDLPSENEGTAARRRHRIQGEKRRYT